MCLPNRSRESLGYRYTLPNLQFPVLRAGEAGEGASSS
jgi:hypothetical protein